MIEKTQGRIDIFTDILPLAEWCGYVSKEPGEGSPLSTSEKTNLAIKTALLREVSQKVANKVANELSDGGNNQDAVRLILDFNDLDYRGKFMMLGKFLERGWIIEESGTVSDGGANEWWSPRIIDGIDPGEFRRELVAVKEKISHAGKGVPTWQQGEHTDSNY